MTRHERDSARASAPPPPARSALWQLIAGASDAVALAGGASYLLHALNGCRRAGPSGANPGETEPCKRAAQDL
jgi:hypothetical protein